MLPKNCASIQNTGQTISLLEDVLRYMCSELGLSWKNRPRPFIIGRFVRFLKWFQGNMAHSITATRSGGIEFTISNRLSWVLWGRRTLCNVHLVPFWFRIVLHTMELNMPGNCELIIPDEALNTVWKIIKPGCTMFCVKCTGESRTVRTDGIMRFSHSRNVMTQDEVNISNMHGLTQ